MTGYGSTAAAVNDISGRGVGMGAVRAETLALGGQMSVESSPGVGTCFSFLLPLSTPGP